MKRMGKLRPLQRLMGNELYEMPRVCPTCVFVDRARFLQGSDAFPRPRFDAGSLLQEPENLYSKNGLLEVSFSYQTRVDSSATLCIAS